MNGEEWRPVVEFEGVYEVSSRGRVRSLDRCVTTRTGSTQRHRSVILKGTPASHGYLTVRLRTPGVSTLRLVHRLVCEAFHGPPPEGKNYVCHSDGDPLNNTPENLRWGSARDNAQDAVKHGRNYASNRITCPLGHPYESWNLTLADRRLGRRRCKACNRGHANSRRLGLNYLDKEIADNEFRRIQDERNAA